MADDNAAAIVEEEEGWTEVEMQASDRGVRLTDRYVPQPAAALDAGQPEGGKGGFKVEVKFTAMYIPQGGKGGSNGPSGIRTCMGWCDVRKRWPLVVGDVAAFTVCAWIGEVYYIGDSTFGLDIVGLAAPFCIGWMGVAPLMGAYKPNATTSQKDMVKALAPAWAVAVTAGVALVAALAWELPPLSFTVEAMAITGVVVFGWRGIYVLLANHADVPEKLHRKLRATLKG